MNNFEKMRTELKKFVELLDKLDKLGEETEKYQKMQRVLSYTQK